MKDLQQLQHENKALLDQVEYLFEKIVTYGIGSGMVTIALTGLASLVEEIDPDGMHAALARGKGPVGSTGWEGHEQSN